MDEDTLQSCGGCRVVFPELVAAGTSAATYGGHCVLYRHAVGGYICMLMAGTWMSRLLKNNLMDDVFNTENESFMQETRLIENEYSVNLPTRFYYNKKWNNGWINVVNPFRASLVLGTPGSGKSYAW